MAMKDCIPQRKGDVLKASRLVVVVGLNSLRTPAPTLQAQYREEHLSLLIILHMLDCLLLRAEVLFGDILFLIPGVYIAFRSSSEGGSVIKGRSSLIS